LLVSPAAPASLCGIPEAELLLEAGVVLVWGLLELDGLALDGLVLRSVCGELVAGALVEGVAVDWSGTLELGADGVVDDDGVWLEDGIWSGLDGDVEDGLCCADGVCV